MSSPCRRCAASPPRRSRSASTRRSTPGVLSTIESSTYWTGDIDAEHFERHLDATLKRGTKHPEIPRDAIRALAAAEGVAIAEGRGPRHPPTEWRTSWPASRASTPRRADPLSDATIELALRTRAAACATRRRGSGAEYTSEEGRAQFRAELDGLRKRLLAAQATRRVRARAPNAVRVPALRQVPAIPINWREISLHMMQEDALALVSALRDETGAVTSVPMSDLTLRAMPFDWDAREMLETIMGEPFDERVGDDRAELVTGLPVFVWWPDVSPAPEIRQAIDGWESVGWGFAQLTLRGATADRVLRSTWQHPTGTEVRESKFSGAGPWRDVAGRCCRKKVSAVKSLIRGPLGGVASDRARAHGRSAPRPWKRAKAGERSTSAFVARCATAPSRPTARRTAASRRYTASCSPCAVPSTASTASFAALISRTYEWSPTGSDVRTPRRRAASTMAIARPSYDEATTVPPGLAVARPYRRESTPRSANVSRSMRHTRVRARAPAPRRRRHRLPSRPRRSDSLASSSPRGCRRAPGATASR